MGKAHVIYWFRTDLRLHDSPALKAALDLEPETFYPIWCWDPHYVYRARVGVNRFQFLLDCQIDLSTSITKLNGNSRLFVIREAPQTLLPKLFKAWKITHLVFEKDTDAYGRERDEQVETLAKKSGVRVLVIPGRTLWDSDELVKANGGKPTMSLSQTQSAGKKVGDIARPIPAPREIPNPGKVNLDFKQAQPSVVPDFNLGHRKDEDKSYSHLAGPNEDFAPPTLQELGMPEATTPHRGGEKVALAALRAIIANVDYTATFEKPKTAPTAFEPQATTLLSPHLHFGSLSCREFYWSVQDVIDGYKGTPSQPPTSLTGQLLFRDMYFGAQAALGWSFGQTYNNSHCRFIPWHLPSKIDSKSKLISGSYFVDNSEAEMWFKRWKAGVTGFPWIDALMRQLKQEGWIHHLGRHAVACFLTRGGCYVDWERGAEVFEEWLIDHEAACNIGNWQWLGCTAFFSQFYRCYSPIAFPQKWDKNGDFVRRFVPELKAFDKKYIYEPWRAPIADQKRWGCIIKGDGSDGGDKDQAVYPKPMFDFSKRRQVCIDSMKSAYDIGLYGNDQRVLDGSWRALFRDDAEGPTVGNQGPSGAAMKNADERHVDSMESAEEQKDEAEEDSRLASNKSSKKREKGNDHRGPQSHEEREGQQQANASRHPGQRTRQQTLDNSIKRRKRS